MTADAPTAIRALLARVHLVPVVVVDGAGAAVSVARALAAGGIHVMEVTLRTPGALKAAAAVVRECPEVTVGIGTVTRPEELDQAREAGAGFAVSPGIADPLIQRARELDLPYLPGVSTPSEAMHGLTAGLDALKFYPAELAGGVDMLAQLAEVFPRLAFCPTGGVKQASLGAYLALGNVVAAGGSWITPESAIAAGDWGAIEDRARAALRTAERVIEARTAEG